MMGSKITHVSQPKLAEYKFQPYVLKKLKPKSPLHQLPKGRSGHRIVSDDAYVYSFGGFNPFLDEEGNTAGDDRADLKLFKEIWRFDIARMEWENLVHFSFSLPKELVSNAVVLKGNTMIVHGGTGVPFGYNNSNKTYITNLREGKDLKLIETQGDHPFPQYGQAMVWHNHELYVVGGTSGFEYFSNIYCLNLKTKVWRAVYIHKGISYNEPMGRYRHEVAFYNNRIIIFGGGADHDVFELQHLPAYNIKNNEWEILTTIADPNDKSGGDEEEHPGFPSPRRCHGGVQIPEEDGQDSEYVICGGCNGVEIYSDVWKLNLKTLQWTRWKKELPFGLNFHSASLSPCGKMFVFGGICELYSEDEDILTIRTNDIFSSWVKIPKLSEMCWEALLFYNPDIVDFPKSKLITSGVPLHFVDRVCSQ